MDDLVTRDDEDRRDEDNLLWERGIDPTKISEDERKDLVDDLRSENVDIDDDQLSDVVPPEESDGND